MPDPLVVTIAEGARLLCISPDTLRRLLGSVIPRVRIGRAVRVRVSDLEAYLAAAAGEAPESAAAAGTPWAARAGWQPPRGIARIPE